jgi:DNA mismatch repair protein MSH6
VVPFCQITVASNGCRLFGLAFLDYAALKIWVGSLHDDDSLATLGALLVQVRSFKPFCLVSRL